MLETALRAFATFFATVGPFDVAALFAVLTTSSTLRHRRAMAIKGTLIATLLLLSFTLFGDDVLHLLGITLPALKTSGGVLLLLMAIDMVFARPSGMTSTTVAETSEAEHKSDIAVFPLATPLIAGPGALGAAALLIAEVGDDLLLELTVIAALLTVMAITLVSLLIAAQLQRLLSVTGQNVINRVVGVLLAALSVQFIFDGVRESELV